MNNNRINATNNNTGEGGGVDLNVEVAVAPPNTPLTMMRSVMNSMQRDRSEIEGARRGLFDTNNTAADQFNSSYISKNDNGLLTRGNNTATNGSTGLQQTQEGSSYYQEEEEEEYDNTNTELHQINKNSTTTTQPTKLPSQRNNDTLYYEQRQINSSCLPYESEITLRFRHPSVLASISVVQPLQQSYYRNKNRVCFVVNEGYTTTTTTTTTNPNNNTSTVGLRGGGVTTMAMGGGENKFVVSKASSSGSGGIANNEEEETTMDNGTAALNNDYPGEVEQDSVTKKYLCYGDKIILRSGVMRRVLGVQKEKVPGGDDDPNKNNNNIDEGNNQQQHQQQQIYTLSVGCFRRPERFPTANTWTVLRGGSGATIVTLGNTQLDHPTSLLEDDNMMMMGGKMKNKKKKKVPVYSGDPIVLQNEWTGGILSLGDECSDDDDYTSLNGASMNNAESTSGSTSSGWSLNIITSSYQMNTGGGASTQDDLPLIEYLQQHNKVLPGKKETFQIVASDVPPVPQWAYTTGEASDRMYLNGLYLKENERHERLGGDMEYEMFGEEANNSDDDGDGDGASRKKESLPLLAQLSVDVQEQILLDEVIGAMMGHEGQFMRYQIIAEDDDDEDEDSHQEAEEEYATEPEFAFASESILGGAIDSSLENIVSRILPLCTNYAYVNRYVSSCMNHYECGVIARTLCEAINDLLEEYLAFVSNLDYMTRDNEPANATTTSGGGQQLTLSMVHVHAQPSIRTMAILSQVVSTVSGKKGGELLNSLYNLMSLNYSGDEKGHKLLEHLLTKCAAPYANMLQSWLKRGKVHDPYGEFMIEVTDKSFRENHVTLIKQGMEWTEWCREKEEHVLRSLHDSNQDILPVGNAALGGVDRSRATSHMSAMHKAHATGKYWRAIHCCHDGAALLTESDETKDETASNDEQAKVLLNPLKLSRFIDQAYHEASDTLLRMLLDEYGLLSSLRFMKKYFLLDQGDFFVDFLDGAEDELHKELPNVLQGRVQNWLTTSIARTSETSSQLASALRISFQNKSLRDTLDDLGKRTSRKSSKKNARQKVLAGFEAITFEFKSVPFPTSIVLSRDQLRIYQLIFRLIFFAKYVERQLVNMWSDHQLLKAMMSLRAATSPTFSLRRRMLHFIQNFVYYLKFDVIEPNWRELESKLNATKEHYCNRRGSKEDSTSSGQFPRTVDDMLHDHNQFLLRISGQCLLTNFDLIERASKIMTTCLLFSTQIKRFMETTKVHELHEMTRHERSKLRYGTKKSKNGEQETDFRADREDRTQRCSNRIHSELCTETYQHMITRFDEVFSAHLAEFMKNLNSDYGQKNNAHLTNLAMQLDYNGFLSSSIPAKQ